VPRLKDLRTRVPRPLSDEFGYAQRDAVPGLTRSPEPGRRRGGHDAKLIEARSGPVTIPAAPPVARAKKSVSQFKRARALPIVRTPALRGDRMWEFSSTGCLDHRAAPDPRLPRLSTGIRRHGTTRSAWSTGHVHEITGPVYRQRGWTSPWYQHQTTPKGRSLLRRSASPSGRGDSGKDSVESPSRSGRRSSMCARTRGAPAAGRPRAVLPQVQPVAGSAPHDAHSVNCPAHHQVQL